MFRYMSFAIPVERLHETNTLIAFYHPKPSYRFHVLIVPKRSIASLTTLSSSDSDFMIDLFETIKTLVAKFELEKHGYRLICNGGEYQDVPLLHFHLVADQL
jgi:histidine triad (HIT) family protein